jgi:Putative DNA-binding domain
MNKLTNLIKERESEWLDFKKQFHENNAELLHDILCLSNAFYAGDRFLIFGIANDKSVCNIQNDPNKKTNADLQDFLRQINLNFIPKIELEFHELDGNEIGVLHIFNSPQKPHFVCKDFVKGKVKVRAGVIYTRLSDTNIPRNETSPDNHIEVMWKERLGLLNQKHISLEEHFPVKLDDSRKRVQEIFGEPDATGWQIEHYYSEGIEISYDQHSDMVDGLVVYHLPSGTAFEGTVFGIRLGDSFAKIKEILGRPAFWGLAYEKSSMAVWNIDKKLLVVEIWSNRNRDNTIPSQQLGTAKSIIYCNRKSFVGYNVIVVLAIEQIRLGKIPSQFERDDITLLNIELNDPIFSESYELLGAQASTIGGAEVWVGFTESKTLIKFWIYPLQRQYPVIRGIWKTSENANEVTIDS